MACNLSLASVHGVHAWRDDQPLILPQPQRQRQQQEEEVSGGGGAQHGMAHRTRSWLLGSGCRAFSVWG